MVNKNKGCGTEFWSDFSKNNSSALIEPLVVSDDPLGTAIFKFKNHPSVKLTDNIFNNAGASFPFQYVSLIS